MKRYSSKEPLVFVWIIIPYIVFMNLLIYGSCIFDTATTFIKGFFYSAFYFFIIYAIFGTVAVFIHKRYPAAGELFKSPMLSLWL